MNKGLIIKTAMIIGTAGLLASTAYGYLHWQSNRPSTANFDKALRAIWEKKLGDNVSGETTRGISQCVFFPGHPKPYAQSKSQKPLSWHRDFITDGVTDNARLQQLNKLEQLVKAGFLEKEAMAIEENGSYMNGSRYRLSIKGWIASNSRHGPGCFVYGQSRYLGITKATARATKAEDDLDIYMVQARTGVASTDDLEPWARSAEAQAAFPEIRKQLDGEEISVLLIRGDKGWVDYSEVLMKAARGLRNTTSQQESDELKAQQKQYEKRLAELDKLPAPRREEIAEHLKTQYSRSGDAQWPKACLYLPGAEKLPVDRNFSSRRESRYEVAIFTNKDLKKRDSITNKTQPYLDQLEQLGVLSKTARSEVASGKKNDEQLYNANIYTLTPEYINRIDESDPKCFQLGKPKLEILDISIRNNNHNSQNGASFSYKLQLHYPDAPAWMHDSALQAAWPELQGVMKKGYACSGHFDFNKETRKTGAGGGSCWWAFDSYYEN